MLAVLQGSLQTDKDNPQRTGTLCSGPGCCPAQLQPADAAAANKHKQADTNSELHHRTLGMQAHAHALLKAVAWHLLSKLPHDKILLLRISLLRRSPSPLPC